MSDILPAPSFRRLGDYMSFFSRLPVPRGVRRAMHPGRTLEPAVAPNASQEAGLISGPIDNPISAVVNSAEAAADPGSESKAAVFQHGSCPVRHRSEEAAAKCKNS